MRFREKLFINMSNCSGADAHMLRVLSWKSEIYTNWQVIYVERYILILLQS